MSDAESNVKYTYIQFLLFTTKLEILGYWYFKSNLFEIYLSKPLLYLDKITIKFSCKLS